MNIIKRVARRIKGKILHKKKPEVNVLDLNSRYDLETIEIIKSIGRNANCIDIGAHRGDILKHMLKYAPAGEHFAFEPLPHLYDELQAKFGNQCKVYPYALGAVNAETSFNYVVTNPAYSGIKKRVYDRPDEEDKTITVRQRRLDDIIPKDTSIQLIKIDVEGGEFDVVRGAENILRTSHPVIIYEQGIGGSDIYGTRPESFFDFMASFGYSISLMEYYLLKKKPFNKDNYCLQFNNGYNFYFVAYHEHK
jgi:FkbM family methyltransferase